MKIAIYTRISTEDQTTDPQRQELREYCERRGWTDVAEFTDRISGAKFTRLGLESLMAAVRRGRVNGVVCAKLDRLGRSVRHLAQLFAEFEAHRVALICPAQGIDTSNESAAARFQMQILSAVAEFERDLIRERTKAGLRAARARGSKLGRPAKEIGTDGRELIRKFRDRDPGGPSSIRDLAQALRVSTGKAHSLVRAVD